MSRNGSVDLEFGDGEYRFRLAVGQTKELQEKFDAGPSYLARKGMAQELWPHESSVIIRLGLIGGGMPIDEARKMAKRYVEDEDTAYPWAQASMIAGSIIAAATYGVEDESPGKRAAGAESKKTRSRAKKSDFPGSTETGQ